MGMKRKHLKVFLETTPLMCSVWEMTGKVIDCNEEHWQVLGLEQKEDYLADHAAYWAGQPAGADWQREILQAVREQGRLQRELAYISAAGETIPTRTTFCRLQVTGEADYVLVCSLDLRDMQAARQEREQASQRIAAMLNSMPYAAYLISQDFRVIDCNEAALELFQVAEKEELISKFLQDYSPKYQADGRLSLDKAKAMIARAYQDGRFEFEWIHQIPATKELVYSRITLVRVQWDAGEPMLCAYSYDLRPLKNYEAELIRRAELLEAVNEVSREMMAADISQVEDKINLALQTLAQTVAATRVTIWENITVAGEAGYRRRQSWPADRLDGREERKYSEIPYLKERLDGQRSYHSGRDELPQAERIFMYQVGEYSTLVLPIVFGEEAWGFISFGDVQKGRSFCEYEEYALKSGSTVIAIGMRRAAVKRELLERNEELRKTTELLTGVNRAAHLLLNNESQGLNEVTQKVLKLLGLTVNVEQASLWRYYQGEDGADRIKKQPYWRRGKKFAACRDTETLLIRDYIPMWEPEQPMPPQEISYAADVPELAAFRERFGCRFLLLLPLQVTGQFWGFMVLNHNVADSCFMRNEIEILQSGGLMLAEAINRSEISQDLRRFKVRAEHDGMTGLLNRSSFVEKTEELLQKSQMQNRSCAIMYIDIDYFKSVNDTYGHAFGDQVLIQLARILKYSIRPDDISGRLGGEEFGIAYFDVDAGEAQKTGRRLMEKIKKLHFPEYPEFGFTVSIGVYSRVPQPEDGVGSWLKKADQALYQAKQSRNCMVAFVDREA